MENPADTDTYYTIAAPAEALYKEKGSKFLCYAYPVRDEDRIREYVEALRKRYYDATHHCYAWRLGPEGASFRANDDGEPSSTAGRPILGQLLSRGITDTLVVVVRYFGGTKLGVPGLIAAYRESAAAVLDEAERIEKTVNARFVVEFGYLAMNDVMRVVKEMQPVVADQCFDNACRMTLSIRRSREEALRDRLSKVEGLHMEFEGYE
ncbi:YigZ family protein [uncultured Alistipes sp.]|uniref:IMPACT family protein n=1 Tax=uncultured Alistipes sp. TaxID=538949 RepID=UPI002627E79F|nr:YigZ family protein [uncultured Alistipes sp.]